MDQGACGAAGVGMQLDAEQLVDLAQRMRDGDAGVSRDAQATGKQGVRTFSASAAADWLQRAGGLDASGAQAALGGLQAANLVTVAGADGSSCGDGAASLGSLAASKLPHCQLAFSAELQPKAGAPLNSHFEWYGTARPAAQVSEDLRRQLLSLYGQYVDDEGRYVDYAGMSRDAEFDAYRTTAAELQKVDVSSLAREERLAFFVNCYNSLVIHANAVTKPAKTLLGRLNFFDSISYTIGGLAFTANDIEHGVLRGNGRSPTAIASLVGFPQYAPRWFKASDPRLPLAIMPPDPRIHFALNCGAISCPAIRVYNQRNIEVGLAGAARAFIKGEVTLVPEAREVVMSKIFKWYKNDFAADDAGLLRFIASYMEESQQAQLQAMMDNGGKGVKIRYKEYDWTVNAKPST